MKKLILAYGVLFLVIITIVILRFNLLPAFERRVFPSYAELGNKRFSLLLAKTEKEKVTGLSNTNWLKENEGMLFIFDKKDYYSFWMRNMKFPIDILFIDGDTIVDLYENLQPASQNADISKIPRYQSKKPVNYVLEISGGLAKKLNVKVGSKVKIKVQTNSIPAK